ncbi:MAG: tetratricopeptide repeat protein [Bacteroidia bacterium]|nr:tetratricopeptide repeat protein [Bacteroidia bacterium]
MNASPRSEQRRLIVWSLTGLAAAAGLFFLGQRRSVLSKPSAQEEISLAFWQAEAGTPPTPEKKKYLASLLNQIPDSSASSYALAVTYLLIYGAEELSAPPMVYIQRLQQLRSVPSVLAYLGRLAYHTGQIEKAQKYLREAIESDPTCGTAYLFLSRIESDSACAWLTRGAQATYTPAERLFRDQLKARLSCS